MAGDAEATQRGTGDSATIENAAWRILSPGLRGEPSSFDSSLVTWTAPVAQDMLRRVQDEPDLSKASFLVKLQRQLEGAPRSVGLLAAELLCIQVLPLSNVKPRTKRTRISTVLYWLDPVPEMPAEVAAGLAAEGVFHGGVGFNVQIWQQLLWLCRFVSSWSAMPATDRDAALADPWAFREAAVSTHRDWPSIRHSLEYLTWPGWFEPIVASDQRRQIRDAFAYRIGGASGTDDEWIAKDLHAIRQVIDAEAGHRVDFYRPPYVHQWSKRKDVGQRAWLIRPRQGGADLVARWEDEGLVSLAADHLGHVPAGSDMTEVRSAVEAGYEHEDYAQRLALAHEYYAFLTRMKADDLVITTAADTLRFGVISGEPEYAVPAAGDQLQRPVAWFSTSVPRSHMPPMVQSLLEQQGTVVDVTAGLDALSIYLPEPDAENNPVTDPVAVELVPILPTVTDNWAQSVFMPRTALQEIVDVLQARQQIVLYGPPGTGKTYLARKLAEFLVGGEDPSRARLVQFHPSYAYEDFFEGYRPDETASGQATFKLQPGPLRALAAEARREGNTSAPFVLIIDELNRANIAKVFGELYFLLEYRGESIRLQYRPAEAFHLPRNLFIIATMNTADRSVAAVDAAIRRRFPFIEMHPDEPPVRDLLATYLAAQGKPDDERIALLEALNAAIEDHDRDFRIGPSYLMRPEADTPAGLERIWKYDLLPLLEEQYYGRMTRLGLHDQFGLAVIRRSIELGAARSDAEPMHEPAVPPT